MGALRRELSAPEQQSQGSQEGDEGEPTVVPPSIQNAIRSREAKKRRSRRAHYPALQMVSPRAGKRPSMTQELLGLDDRSQLLKDFGVSASSEASSHGVHDPPVHDNADGGVMAGQSGEALEAALVDPSQAERDVKPTRVMMTQRRGSLLALQGAVGGLDGARAKPTRDPAAKSRRASISRPSPRAPKSATQPAEKVQVIELGNLLPGDYVGESSILSVAHGVQKLDMMALEASGPGMPETPTGGVSGPSRGPRASHQEASRRRKAALREVLEQTAPASVVADTAVEIVLIKRDVFYHAVSFATRQSMREAAMKAAYDRKVITSEMRVKWTQYCKQLRNAVLADTTRMRKALSGLRMPRKLEEMAAPAVPGSGDPFTLAIDAHDPSRQDDRLYDPLERSTFVEQALSGMRR